MGNKSASKIRMLEAGVPCVPGYQGDDQSDATLIAEGKKIGLPVMVKAAAGGGGRGMRLVHDEAELATAITSARSEASNAFGSGQLLRSEEHTSELQSLMRISYAVFCLTKKI